MTKNPVINALGASGYIILVVSILNFISLNHKNQPDTTFAPVVFLSLFTLSAAMMAAIFFYQPLLLYIDGKKTEAIKLFVQTVGVFAIFTIIALILLFTGII